MEVSSAINGSNNNVQINGHKDQSNGSKTSQQHPEQRSANGFRQDERQQHDAANTEPLAEVNTRAIKCQEQIKQLRLDGQVLRSDAKQPELSVKPPWFEEDLFENAKSVYGRHFMGVNFAHLSGLLLLVRVNSIYRTLNATGRSDSVAKLFKRYYQTIVHIKRWYEGDIFEENSEAQRSLLLVRAMHNGVSTRLNDEDKIPNDVASKSVDAPKTDDESSRLIDEAKQAVTESLKQHANQVHISEYDIMITQFAFIGFIVTRAKYIGLIEDFSEHDLKSVIHFWRVIGYYLGASEQFNLCSRDLEGTIDLCEAMMEVEFKQSILKNPISSAPGIMGVNIVRSIKFVPMLTIYGITKYLYELINIDTSEFEERATRYSRLSYTLIKLVMSRLLAYRGFRWFNNGLTRLSVFLVGKIEETFANYLDSKYGHELKL